MIESNYLNYINSSLTANGKVMSFLCAEALLEQHIHRFPALSDVKVSHLVNRAEAFTPDCKYIIGRSPEVRIKGAFTLIELISNILANFV